MDEDDISGATAEELAALYVDCVRRQEGIGHVAAYNRNFARRAQIAAELKARGDIAVLRAFLDHAELPVREAASGDLHVLEAPPPAPSEWTISPDALWQALNPPPAPLAREEAERRIRDAFDARTASGLVALMRPAIRLWPQRPAADMPPRASRLGGMPHAPQDWGWPQSEEAEGEPMLFLAQIDCAELKGMPGAEELPSGGILSFFGDHETVTGIMPGGGCVFHFSDADALVPAEAGLDPAIVFPMAAIAFDAIVDLPDPHRVALRGVLKDGPALERYARLRDAVRFHGLAEDRANYCGFSKLLGWPALVQQYDLWAMEGEEQFRLLLQLDEFSNGEAAEGFGPGGSLYFVLPQANLAAGKFGRCEPDAQFT